MIERNRAFEGEIRALPDARIGGSEWCGGVRLVRHDSHGRASVVAFGVMSN